MTERKVVPLRVCRAPAAKRARKRAAWTVLKKAKFLASLAATSNVSASARACRMSESAVYRLRQRSPEFRAEWQAALREGYARLELMMLERAMHGTQKPVFHGGQQVGVVTEYSDRQAMTLLTLHRTAVMGDAPAATQQSDPAEVRQRILDKLAEMGRRLGDDAAAGE